MIIHEMTLQECHAALERTNFGRLACSRDNQPYVLPVYYAYDEKHIYAFSTPGKKIEWMRANPRVCLEIDERTSHDRWMSVVVIGEFEELPETPEFGDRRVHAHKVLQERGMWWDAAFANAQLKGETRPFTEIFYRIHTAHITGHRATPSGPRSASGAEPQSSGWISRILGRR
jgi:nitroimidazol reductase NimA-like FMN-containing flavoprotein (pyridoxamine 5'-phosphate oxidase superfamily)